MRAKSTEAAKEAIRHHGRIIAHLASCIRVKRKFPDSQADWLKKYSEDFLVGQATGAWNALESLLFSQRCYYGFEYVRFEGDKTIRCTPEETEEWCRNYIVKG